MKLRWNLRRPRHDAEDDAEDDAAGGVVRVPGILQFEAVECGAASLAMVLAHYGRWVPLEELRIACGVSRDGTKASNLLHAARSFGLEARGYRKEPEDLRSIRVPCIVFWNFNHFLVLEGFAGAWVYLNDPALGRRRVGLEEFDQSFTGVVLTFEPTDEFRRGGEAPSVLRSIVRRARGMESALAFLVAAGLAAVVPGMVLPVFLSVFVDRVLVANSGDWLRPLLLGMALAALLRAALAAIQNGVLLRLQTRLAVSSAGRFLWHLLRLPVVFYTQRSAGEIGSRMQLNELVARELTGNVAGTCVSLLTAAFFALVMAAYDTGLAAIVIAGAAAIGGSLWYVARSTRELSQRVSIDEGKVQGTSLIGLAAMETIKSYGGEAGFFARWAGYQARFMNALASTQRLSLPIALIPGFITAAVNVLVLGFGGARVIQGQISVGELVAFQSLAASFLRPVNEFVDLGARFQQLQGSLARLDDVLRYPAIALDAAAGAPAGPPAPAGQAPAVHVRGRLEGFVELRGVSFGYSRTAPPLIENLSLVATPGQRIALVGPSGCGKSTVSRLIMGLYEPWSGEILFDGKPRHCWPREQLAASLALVDQELALFEGSYRDNLSLWDPTIPEEALFAAAKDACIHEVIAARTGGYDGRLEQGGQNLSGGQRQRIEIARALAGGPRILVLDEATSALDVATEREVDRNLRRRGVTCVVIAHRLSTVRDADQIIVLERGKVVERGTHETLMAAADGASPGHYRRLVDEGMGT